MNKKTVSISLPQIEGVELKSATVDLNKGVVVTEYEEEDLYLTVKKGDFLTCLSDPSKTVIFGEKAWSYGGLKTFTILYDLPMIINGKVARTPIGTKFPFSNFRYSTEEEKARMIKEMEKWGKRYNPETRRIEDIEKDVEVEVEKDISEIVVDLGSAVDYLLKDLHQHAFSPTKKHISKLEAINQLMILAEAWNKFDEFKPDWENPNQCKYYPLFEFINGKFEFSYVVFTRFISDAHMSNFIFKTSERAKQFGRQFIDLFRVVLSN